MIRLIGMIAAVLVSTAAFAQQQNDPAFLARAISAMQSQRNVALDSAVMERARADGIADELAKAQARIKELEPKPETRKPD
jgi:hypothetical protein